MSACVTIYTDCFTVFATSTSRLSLMSQTLRQAVGGSVVSARLVEQAPLGDSARGNPGGSTVGLMAQARAADRGLALFRPVHT